MDKDKVVRVGGIERAQVTPNAKSKQVYCAFLNVKTPFTGSRSTVTGRVEFTVWDCCVNGKSLQLKNGKKIVEEWRVIEFPLSTI